MVLQRRTAAFNYGRLMAHAGFMAAKYAMSRAPVRKRRKLSHYVSVPKRRRPYAQRRFYGAYNMPYRKRKGYGRRRKGGYKKLPRYRYMGVNIPSRVMVKHRSVISTDLSIIAVPNPFETADIPIFKINDIVDPLQTLVGTFNMPAKVLTYARNYEKYCVRGVKFSIQIQPKNANANQAVTFIAYATPSQQALVDPYPVTDAITRDALFQQRKVWKYHYNSGSDIPRTAWFSLPYISTDRVEGSPIRQDLDLYEGSLDATGGVVSSVQRVANLFIKAVGMGNAGVAANTIPDITVYATYYVTWYSRRREPEDFTFTNS